MVQSALVVGSVALWLGRLFAIPGQTERRKYKMVLDHYNNNYINKKHKGRGGGFLSSSSPEVNNNTKKGGKKSRWYNRLPNISANTIYFLFRLAELFAVFALYYYLNGNCQFDKYRIFDEDDEFGNSNWVKGAIVLSFSITCWFLGELWMWLFFTKRKFAISALVAVIILALGVTILWAMPTTDRCIRDSFEHRFWIAFGLWMIYMIYIVFLFYLSSVWARLIGSRINKKDSDYKDAVVSYHNYRTEKKLSKHFNRWQRFSTQYGNSHAQQQQQQQQMEKGLSSKHHQEQPQLHPQNNGGSNIPLTAVYVDQGNSFLPRGFNNGNSEIEDW